MRKLFLRGPLPHRRHGLLQGAGHAVQVALGELGVDRQVQDLGGGVRFGPNMEWTDTIDYTPDECLRAQFETAVRRYWPGLPEAALMPDTVGIRPRIWGPGEAKRSFEFQNADVHGIKGLVQLFGFESPGLTSCLAIAERVGGMLGAA